MRSFFIHFVLVKQISPEQKIYFDLISCLLWRLLGTKLSWSAINHLCIYRITLLGQKQNLLFKKQLHFECFFSPVWESCAFFSCDTLQPPFSSVGMTNNAVEGGTMRGPSEGLISPAQVHPSSGIASCEGGGGGWEWRQGEGGLKWFVTWFCSLLGVFYEPLPFLGVRCSLRSVRIEVILVFHPFFGFKGVCLCVFSQRENHGGLTDDWLIQFTLHPV